MEANGPFSESGHTATVEVRQTDTLCINAIRALSIDAVQRANSGHPGMPLGAAAMGYVLWTRFLKHAPANPGWFNRDRFVLSAGHGSMLLYSLLHLSGYDLSIEEIKRFRQWGSKTPGHPEFGLTPGVETTTGPLGQGFGNGVGMAIAEAHLASRFNRPDFPVIDHCTWGIVSDGDLMEGVASETASLAGHLKLGKLIYLYDCNHVTLSGGTALTFTEDWIERFQSYGWHTWFVEDGNDIAALPTALAAAQAEKTRPSLITVRTHIGYGSPHKQDTFEAHGSPLGEEETLLTKENLGWPLDPPFYVPDEVRAVFRRSVETGRRAEEAWNELVAAYARHYPDSYRELAEILSGSLPEGWDNDIETFAADEKGMATRVASGKVLRSIAPHIGSLIGGSCDLDPSTHTMLPEGGDCEGTEGEFADRQGSAGGAWSLAGRNIHFGVREHAMGAICNGLSLHGLIPFAATFLIFSDYMRPPMRLAAIMRRQVIYVFTHDSIGLGEDGTTHQPVEQLAGLRAMPRLRVIRPADANETAVAWRVAIETRDRPTALILSRQNVPTLDRTRYAAAEGLRKGAYVLSGPSLEATDLILIATGSEVCLAVAAQQSLAAKGIGARVVSMPSFELFAAQDAEYRASVLPSALPARLAIEAASPLGWHAWVGDRGEVVGLADFGASAPADVLMREYGFTVTAIVDRATLLLNRLRRPEK
jgi:transketolase